VPEALELTPLLIEVSRRDAQALHRLLVEHIQVARALPIAALASTDQALSYSRTVIDRRDARTGWKQRTLRLLSNAPPQGLENRE
jgi:hypothetical protein